MKIRNFADATIAKCENRRKDKKTHDIIYFFQCMTPARLIWIFKLVKNARVQVICHKLLVCQGKCSFSLFLSSATGYKLDTQKFPSSESGIPPVKTANRSLYSFFLLIQKYAIPVECAMFR